MNADQRAARKYLEGAIMAYRDCAEIAEKIGKHLSDFGDVATAKGTKRPDSDIAVSAGQTICRNLSESFRAKLATVDAMITDTPGKEH